MPTRTDRSWRARGVRNGAVAAVSLALIALVAAPLPVQWHVDRLRERRIDLIQSARDQVSELQLSLAMQMASLRGFALGGDRAFLSAYEDAAAAERAALDSLQPMSERLGPTSREAYARLEEHATRWRRHVAEVRAADRARAPTTDRAPIAIEQMTYERTLAASVELRDALLAEAARNRADIRDAERIGFAIHVLLVVVGMAATLMLLWLGRRLRRYAIDAERGRAIAEDANAAKARMVRGVSHDLRNPLGVADMAAALLDEADDLDDQQRESVARIRRATAAMNEIIEDLLEVARGEPGALPVRREPVEVADVARATAEDHRQTVEARGLRLSVDVPPSLARVETDPVRVREILRNLLSNATKYTPPGGHVRVGAEVTEDGGAPADGEWVTLHVTDTGPGIPSDAQERIFEEHVRLDTREEGHGIGLNVSRKGARQLGGDLTVESHQGRGSRFTLWLPVGAA